MKLHSIKLPADKNDEIWTVVTQGDKSSISVIAQVQSNQSRHLFTIKLPADTNNYIWTGVTPGDKSSISVIAQVQSN